MGKGMQKDGPTFAMSEAGVNIAAEISLIGFDKNGDMTL